jgi:hypothetical protein
MKVTFLFLMAIIRNLELIRLTAATNLFKLDYEGIVDLR